MTTVVIGMTLFQLLIMWEAWRQFVKQMHKSLNIQWFVLPKAERSYMRRRPGVMTVENDKSVWIDIIK
jgi:hypothetical protein